MKHRQRYLRWIENLSIIRLIGIFVLFYISIAFLFSLVYAAGGWIDSAKGPLDYIYFSFITQSTVGYGEFKPTGAGKAFVVAQTMFSLLFFALGTGIVVVRVLIPDKKAIEFADYLLFDPFSRRFRIRYTNCLPVDLSMGRIEVRLRYDRPDSHDDVLIVRKKIPVGGSTLTVLPSMQPLKTSTLPPEEVLGKHVLKETGISIRLEPSHIVSGSMVVVIIIAQHFAGNVIASKNYTWDFINCGFHEPVLRGLSTKPDWSKWGRYSLTDPKTCEKCDFNLECPFKQRLKGKERLSTAI